MLGETVSPSEFFVGVLLPTLALNLLLAYPLYGSAAGSSRRRHRASAGGDPGCLARAASPGGFLPPDPRVEEPYRVTPQVAIRIAILGVVAVTIFCALFFRLWALQVISGERYLEVAKNNQVRTFRAPAAARLDPRPERRGARLEPAGHRRSALAGRVRPGDGPERSRPSSWSSRELLDIPTGHRARHRRAERTTPSRRSRSRTDVHDDKVNYLLEHQNDFPGVQINQTYQRHYDQGGIAAQILGYVGEISQQQLDAGTGRATRPATGSARPGVEAAYDTYLRGLPGIGRVYVDALGRVTSAREFQPASRGRGQRPPHHRRRPAEDGRGGARYGIRLAHEDGKWAADGGALVAMDPNDGEILALASNPTFDPSIYTGRVEQKKLERARRPEARTTRRSNRAVAGLYPPGSTFKPVTALAALETGSSRRPSSSSARPKEVVDGQTFTNWDPYANEPMTLTTALAASCDTYFYQWLCASTSARTRPLQKWARTMGFGRPTGSTSAPRTTGLMPTPAWRRHYFKTEIDKIWTSGDSVQLGIGQGDVLVTPLQMTRFYALLANGGKLVEPHLVKSVEEPRTPGQPPVVLRPYSPKPAKDVGLEPEQHPRRAGRPLRRDARELRDVGRDLRRVPDPDRRQDRDGREVRAPARTTRACRTRPGGAATGPTTSRRSSSAP